MIIVNCLDYYLAEPWLIVCVYVQIRVRLNLSNHELGADSGSGTVHTWPGVWLEPYLDDFALDGYL